MTEVFILHICHGCGFPVNHWDGKCPLEEFDECNGPEVHGTYPQEFTTDLEWEIGE